jgi:hypothetical protein
MHAAADLRHQVVERRTKTKKTKSQTKPQLVVRLLASGNRGTPRIAERETEIKELALSPMK